jgi:hypothetical protein
MSQPLPLSLSFLADKDDQPLLPYVSTTMIFCSISDPQWLSQLTLDWNFWNHEPK